ncbi:MAG TPA: SDR family oxidoreductase [Candidatus Binataceae bacterium]|nr:SDR family oxidoreductase [Candidatus Binataceae bacterium]
MSIAIVTGTSTGIGLATAVALSRARHHVYATMRNPSRTPGLAQIASSEKLPIKIVTMDVDDDASVSQAIAQVLTDAGRVDILVNNAGVQGSGPIEEVPLAEFRRVMETNYFGVLRCIQAVLPGMRKQRDGHIINVSTIGGRITGLSQGPYCGSKFALEAVSEILAGEVKAFGIRVSIVEPGVTETPIFAKRRRVPQGSPYPQERRMNAIFDAGRKLQIPPSVVADKIVEIVQGRTWKLRYPTGPDAEPYLQYRASISDEEWVNLHSIESDKEFAAIVKQTFGMDLDL